MENIVDTDSADEFLNNIEERVKKRRSKLLKKGPRTGNKSPVEEGDGVGDFGDEETIEDDSDYEDVEQEEEEVNVKKETKKQILKRKADVIR